ncbi:hypothetical protein B0A53_06025 [Rhodotorula sp. CCFEE 5036]|nr:hypothetical protein B0A53_06025 [Rhodotorula sp. CCFEE 5036]
MIATYESLPVPPPSSRSSSRANPSPTSSSSGVSSAFSISGLKRLFGGAGSATSRAASRQERNRNRESIPEEEDGGYRPSVAKRHLANVLTGVGSAPWAEAERESDDRYHHYRRDRSGSRSRTSSTQAPPPAGEDSGASGGELQQGRGGEGGTVPSPATHSSSSRSRSRSRAASSSPTENQNHHPVVLPDGQRFVRPIRLSGASPSVRVSLQNAETGAAIFSSSSGGQSYGSAGGGGRLSSEFRFPAGQHDTSSPTLSEELPPPPPPPTALEEGRPRRLSFTSAIPGLSSFTGGRGGGGNPPRTSLDDDARSVWSVGTGTKPTNTSAYEMMRRLRNEGLSTRYWIKDESAKDCFQCGSAFTTFRRRHHSTHDMPPTPTSSLRHYRPSGMRPRHSRLSTSNSLPEIHDERSPIGAGSRGSPYAQSPIDEEARSVGHQRRPSQEAMPSGVPPRADRQIEAGAAAESDEMYAEGAQSPTLSTATAPFRRSLGDEEHPASSSDSPIEAVDTSAEPSPADSPVLHGLGLDLNEASPDDMDEKSSPFGAAAPVLPRGVSFLPAQELHGGGGGERGLPVLGRSDSRLSGHLIDSLPETPFDMSGIDPDVYHFDAFRAAEAMEVPLSQASTAHIQRTIRQTLVREQVPSVDAWAPVLESLLYDVADRLAMLDEVEVGNFALHDHVRVKRIPGGRPRDSEFVSGVVITKNVMHKSMARHLSNPRIMLVSFPLEYQRNDGQYLSLDKVHAQERQYLETLAVRIQHSVPHIVLAQRNVSQVALEQLKDRGIVVARHVKASALASLSHSFGAEIISSTNGLLDPRIGKCRSFRVQTFVHPRIPGGRKTFLRFEGDSRSNCTIVLRGGSMEDLAKVKRIIHTLVLVVYNAKLEGYLLHDEHVEARVPPIPIARGPISPGEHPKTGTSDEPEENAMAGDLMKDPELSQSFQPYEEVELTGSALVHYPPPYSLQRVAEDSRRVRELRMQRDAEEAQRILEEETNAKLKPASSSSSSITEPLSVEPTSLATPHAISDAAEEQSLASAASSVVDLQLDRPEDLARQALVDEAESAQAQHLAEWKAYSVSAPESFDLRDHQRLFVLESLLLYGDGEPSRLCRPPEVRAIAFYRDTDTTIGQYLRKADAAFQSNEPCPSPTCNEPLHRHTRVFVHDQFILRVAWEEWNSDILHGAIGLSSTCRREGCHCASRLVRASAETSRLSLGRFFDLSFHPSGAFKCLDESCGHDGQADHVRYWHFGRVRVSITMDEIDLRDVVAPPRQVKVRPDRQVELRNAECAQVQHRTQAFFDSVQTRIASFKLDCVAPERQEECQTALAGFSERCEAERRAIEELLRSTYEQAHHSNGIDLINVRRALQERSHAFDADWSAFVKRIVPADFSDFRRASAQLKRIFPEAPASVSPSSRIVSGALPPAIELDEPYDGAEPPPPSPHQATAPDGLERAAEDDHHMASRSELRPGPEQELPVPPEGPVGASGAPVQPPPLSRSSTVRARRPSDGSEDESDSTVCADGEMTATLTFSGSPFIRHHVSPIIDETSAAESERDVPPRRRRNGPQVAALVSAYDIRNAINDSDEDNASVDESGGADDEFDDEHDGPEMDEEGEANAQLASVDVHRSGAPAQEQPQLSRAVSSSMSDALVLSHDSKGVAIGDATNDASIGCTPIPSPSPASADVSTFPKFSEGESSGTERKSLFNTFTSLWNYRNGDFAPLAYPTLPTEHLYLDNPILLRDDEPTSIIAHALSSKKYYQAFESAGLSRIRAGLSSGGIGRETPMDAAEIEEAARSAEEILRGSSQRSFKLGDVELGDISARCTVFWVEQFEALRQQCGCGTQFVESLARCLKWDAAGGKSKVDFMKTLDDRFIVKQLSRPEMEVFARFAPAYFQYMADALFHSKPTVLAKVFGIYRISLGKHYRNVDFLNLFYGRELKQIFDLKGSTRNRRAEENNPVLLDENLIELSLKSPIYVREESKQLVKEAIYNDSQFLADLNVMDYSLVIGVDATKPELVVGIVDYIRTYTWDKRLESWVKETAFLGGTYKSGGPTVITPKQYKARFREAIDGYLLLSPTPWLNFDKMRTVPKETHAASLAATNDAASIVDQPTSATPSLMEHPHPAPAPPPTDSASIFEAALGPF